jgi:hypothetical protein
MAKFEGIWHYHGLGIYLNRQGEWIGMVYSGDFFKNECHGRGIRAWLRNCPIWEKNMHPLGKKRGVFGGRPFDFEGEFAHERPNGEGAATFKDGTC